MFGILVSAFNSILTWILTQVVVKFVVLTALYLVIQAFLSYLTTFIPSPAAIGAGMSSIPSSIWWVMDVFSFTQGVPLVCAAFAAKFIIRRIPLIG